VTANVPIPLRPGRARTMVERNLMIYRHTWPVILAEIFEPMLYLLAFGIGIGRLVGDVPGLRDASITYPQFVAPALLAASAMNGAIFDSTFNVFFKLKYAKLYDAVLATPMGPRDIAVGEVCWSLIRGGLYSAAFLVVAVLTGSVKSWWAVLGVPAAVFIGFAFAALGMFATTFMRSWVDFDYVTLAIQPMFLFSATFFPLSTYPDVLQWLVRCTPLYHGVALERALLLGDMGWGVLWHVLYLLVLGLLGVLGAARRLERLLLS
jgi:lipooligosaccharide transport system permease protein